MIFNDLVSILSANVIKSPPVTWVIQNVMQYVAYFCVFLSDSGNNLIYGNRSEYK